MMKRRLFITNNTIQSQTSINFPNNLQFYYNLERIDLTEQIGGDSDQFTQQSSYTLINNVTT